MSAVFSTSSSLMMLHSVEERILQIDDQIADLLAARAAASERRMALRRQIGLPLLAADDEVPDTIPSPPPEA